MFASLPMYKISRETNIDLFALTDLTGRNDPLLNVKCSPIESDECQSDLNENFCNKITSNAFIEIIDIVVNLYGSILNN